MSQVSLSQIIVISKKYSDLSPTVNYIEISYELVDEDIQEKKGKSGKSQKNHAMDNHSIDIGRK
ncbi:hypothetical protein [Chryseobacterium sp. GP-SGM7]|uniref:hypothetical protein n=1 Tax=Chryseobacterium sp. GP-SGM7 TaxID=3411323 RepID=UPI003B9261D7